MPSPVNVFWFRRDLRLHDNVGLFHCLSDGLPVLPVFIFDTDILDDLEDKRDKRLSFIHDTLQRMHADLNRRGSGLVAMQGKPVACFERLLNERKVANVFTNEDYEPYAVQRDSEVEKMLSSRGVGFKRFKDHLLKAPTEVAKDDGTPYTVFTPYFKRWRATLDANVTKPFDIMPLLNRLESFSAKPFTNLELLGFEFIEHGVPEFDLSDVTLQHYAAERDIPSAQSTTKLSTHLRFGTASVREAASRALERSEKLLAELAWREFFVNVLHHHPHVLHRALKPAYDGIRWRNDEREFERWCNGETGYALVDAGMRELNETGLMHNRVRMVTASFLVKHLLIDWRWGEAYFAQKLLDFDLASNNGNWQWVAGCGADAAPYFRVFNPALQAARFDPDAVYVSKWVPEHGSAGYLPMVDHNMARHRALATYKSALAADGKMTSAK